MPKEDPAESRYNPWRDLDGAAPDELAKGPRPKSKQEEEDDIFSNAHVDVADLLSDEEEHGIVTKTTKNVCCSLLCTLSNPRL